MNKLHPIDRDTVLSESITTLRDWKKLGYFKDFLTLGHYLYSLIDAESYMILRSNFGTISEALLDDNRIVLTTDDNEDFVWSMSTRVVNTFRTIDVLSPVLKVGYHDIIICIPGYSILTEDHLETYINFLDRHCLKYFITMVPTFYIKKETWIQKFKEHEYEYCDDLVIKCQTDLPKYTNFTNLKNIIIFKNNKVPKEQIDAGSSPEN